MVSQVASSDDAGAAGRRARIRIFSVRSGRHAGLAVVATRRLVMAIPQLFIVSALSFLLVSLTPGNAGLSILGPLATPQQVSKLQHSFGLDLPLYQQYWRWLTHALSGNLGTSLISGQPVATLIGQRLPVTLSLMLGGLLLMIVIGVSLGIFSAVRGGVAGRIVDALALIGLALPPFWLGALLIEVASVRLHLLPAIGYVSPGTSPIQWLRFLVLPVLALSLGGIAIFAKNTRDAMLDVLGTEHVRAARANGVPARDIYFMYALKNTALRITTLAGLAIITLLSGTVFVETIFAVPGMGQLLVSSVTNHDLPVVQGIAITFTAVIILLNIAIDILYGILDPRVKVR